MIQRTCLKMPCNSKTPDCRANKINLGFVGYLQYIYGVASLGHPVHSLATVRIYVLLTAGVKKRADVLGLLV